MNTVSMFNPFQPGVTFHIKTNLICSVIRMTCFYTKWLKWVSATVYLIQSYKLTIKISLVPSFTIHSFIYSFIHSHRPLLSKCIKNYANQAYQNRGKRYAPTLSLRRALSYRDQSID